MQETLFFFPHVRKPMSKQTMMVDLRFGPILSSFGQPRHVSTAAGTVRRKRSHAMARPWWTMLMSCQAPTSSCASSNPLSILARTSNEADYVAAGETIIRYADGNYLLPA